MSFFVTARQQPGRDAIARRGWLAAHKWLLLRRTSQLSLLALFIAGPALFAASGVWVLKGNLAGSLLFDTVPMTDWFVALQSLAAGHWPQLTAWLGLAVVVGAYLIVGGRSYCSWVCPVNVVSDAAAWARRRIGLKTGRTPSKALRYWLLATVLVVSAATGTLAWELINPVSLTHRALIFGAGGLAGLASLILAGVFAYDLLIASRGWCGSLCPMGAAYSLLGHRSLVRVAATERSRCNDCMDCFAVCPEPQVIRPALKGDGSPVIRAAACTNCARCVDVCGQDVFRVTHRFEPRREPS